MPDFWEFPTVSMGIGPMNAIYQAQFNKYLHNRGLKDTSEQHVWAFLGDGEMDEPESRGLLQLAAGEELDNLTFVVNCNLQRLDGPVRGNGKIIQELEAFFRGAGWNVIKVVWGRGWDPLLAADRDGALVHLMNTTTDGDYQTFRANDGKYVRDNFFDRDPRTRKMVTDWTDDDIWWKLKRGGHDYRKVYAAYQRRDGAHRAADRHPRQDDQGLRARHVVRRPQRHAPDEEVHPRRPQGPARQPQACRSATRSSRATRTRRPTTTRARTTRSSSTRSSAAPSSVAISAAARRARAGHLPDDSAYAQVKKGSGKQQVATTMAFVRLLKDLMRDKEFGQRIVPIIPDEARTFGMDSFFPTIKIYNPHGQNYTPVDAELMLAYREAKDGQILHLGINEAGSVAAFTAAGSTLRDARPADGPDLRLLLDVRVPAHRRLDLGSRRPDDPRLPHRRHRWSHDAHRRGSPARRRPLAAARRRPTRRSCTTTRPSPSRSRTSSRTACTGCTAPTTPHRRRPQRHLLPHRLQRADDQPAEPENVDREGILRGMYLYAEGSTEGLPDDAPRVQLLASGVGVPWALEAQELLRNDWDVVADVWSVTSWTSCAATALRLRRGRLPRTRTQSAGPWVTQRLQDARVRSSRCPTTCAPCRTRSAQWVPGDFASLGADGFGFSDTRPAARRFFHIDGPSMAVRALQSLAERGEVDARSARGGARYRLLDVTAGASGNAGGDSYRRASRVGNAPPDHRGAGRRDLCGSTAPGTGRFATSRDSAYPPSRGHRRGIFRATTTSNEGNTRAPHTPPGGCHPGHHHLGSWLLASPATASETGLSPGSRHR